MHQIPPIVQVMTAFPYWIGIDQGLDRATAMMREHEIRHLPVKEKGELVGVISDRDIELTLGMQDTPSRILRVRDACVREAYIVHLNEPLDVVLLHMAETRIGSALVVKDGRLAGIFTATDACRHFGEILRQLFPRGGDEAA